MSTDLFHGYHNVTWRRLIGHNLDQSLAQWDWRHVVGAIGAKKESSQLSEHFPNIMIIDIPAPLLPLTSLDTNM